MAMTACRVTNAQDMEVINRCLHDCWFDMGSVAFDAAARELRVPFERPPAPRRSAWAPNSLLRIRGVEECTIEDAQRIGLYDFNEIHYVASARTLRVLTGIPARFDLRIEYVDVAVEDLPTTT
jgi:hypothetical protein